jgi:CubicO group peptidase (beta-lactamase class C family)
MRRIAVVLGIAASLLVVAPLRAADDLLFARFRDYIDALRAQTGIPGLAVVVVGRSDVLWEHASGLQDVDRSIAARPDTRFQMDGLTQTVTASLILRCAEEGRLSVDDPIGLYKHDAPEPGATIRQLLTHTSGPPDGLSYAYRPERLEPLGAVIRACTGDSYRETVANLFDRLAMTDSVPGADSLSLQPPAEGVPSAAAKARYADTLTQLAPGYAVDRKGHATATARPITPLTPAAGLISTARDLAHFDLALRQGVLLRDDTLATAWRAPAGRDRQPLPHGMGWFVQSYKGENVVWQFGVADNASSSLIITIPSHGLTLILLANSDQLAKPFPLAAGDVTVSPFAKLFLGVFVR